MTAKPGRGAAFLIAAVLAAIGLWSASGWPGLFERLPASAQAALYSVQRSAGLPRSTVSLAIISRHGYPAVDAVLPYVDGRKRGIPKSDAMEVLLYVQQRGCDLAGSAAERAVRNAVISGGLRGHDLQAAASLLRAIETHASVPPGAIDGFAGGPCEQRR